MACLYIYIFFFKNFEKVEKTGIISTKFSLRCTPSVILGTQVGRRVEGYCMQDTGIPKEKIGKWKEWDGDCEGRGGGGGGRGCQKSTKNDGHHLCTFPN